MYVAKTKALISCVVTMQLIGAFVFTFAKSRFSHDVAHHNKSQITTKALIILCRGSS